MSCPPTPTAGTAIRSVAELVDGEVWGRGAVDMLNLTATMAVAFRNLARSGFTPRGTLVYLAVADEENLGTWGAEHLLEHERDAVMADYVVTEAGGFQIPTPKGPRLPVIVGEKGSYWCRITVRGTPGHASQPFRTDNALVTAAEVVRRLAEYRPPTMIHDTWRDFIEGVDFGPEWNAKLTRRRRRSTTSARSSRSGSRARPTRARTPRSRRRSSHGGTKTNVIPDHVEIEVDIRTLPGQRGADVRKLLDDALGDLASHVEVTPFDENESTASPTDTPMWDAMAACRPRWSTDRRSCRSSPSAPPTRGSSAEPDRSRTASACSAARSRSRTTPRCSTATTNGSTSTRSCSSTQLWEALAHDFLN